MLGHANNTPPFQYSWQHISNIKFANDSIKHTDLWSKKCLLYQLSHNHCPTYTKDTQKVLCNNTYLVQLVFLNMIQTRLLFVYFCSFHNAKTNKVQFLLSIKSIECEFGIRSRAGRTEDADESTELWRHPLSQLVLCWFIRCKRYLRIYVIHSSTLTLGTSIIAVWPDKNCQMSIKVAQIWFHCKI